MSEPLFERYGEWPDGPIAVPDPNARRASFYRSAIERDPVHNGTKFVLHPLDSLEIERAELGL